MPADRVDTRRGYLERGGGIIEEILLGGHLAQQNVNLFPSIEIISECLRALESHKPSALTHYAHFL